MRRVENANINTTEATQSRRDQKARISFFDPTHQVMLERLILGNEIQVDVDADDENAQATLASVEEMIEGYEWASEDVIGRKMTKGTVDVIEARLLDELTALEKVCASKNCFTCCELNTHQANIHSFLESDDRVGVVMKYVDDALAELDNIEGLISSYKIHLGVSPLLIPLLSSFPNDHTDSQRRYIIYTVTKSWSSGANSEPTCLACGTPKSTSDGSCG